ncbi:MAG: XdhC family protein [Thermoprotei archaeon]|nr:MAG: XdhC family protein [Thermoprotei archaeon]
MVLKIGIEIIKWIYLGNLHGYRVMPNSWLGRVGTSIPDDELMKLVVEGLRSGISVALCLIVSKEGSGPRDVGAKMVVYSDGRTFGSIGGGSFERYVISEALKALKEGKPRLIKFSFTSEKVSDAVDTGLICGGVLTVYIDVLRPSPKVIIAGVGKVGTPLANVLRFLGYRVIIADPNPDLVSRERFPFAEQLITGSPEEIVTKLKDIIREGDIVFVTHGEVNVDYLFVKELLKSSASYVGLLGSKRKVIEFVKRLIRENIPKELLAKKLRAPIGIDINTDTPEEISISVAAEVIMNLRGGNVRTLNIVDKVIRNIDAIAGESK